MPLPSYLRDHAAAAVRCGRTWSQTRHGQGGGGPASVKSLAGDSDLVADYLRHADADGAVDREQVTEMILKRPALGVVAAMVWGGAKPDDFKALLAMDGQQVARRVGLAEIALRDEGLDAAYLLMGNRKPAKLDGLGPAFYTKVLYFLGRAHDLPTPRPLIFDQHTRCAYFALLLDTDGASATDSFTGGLEGDGSPRASSGAYASYCQDMDDWAQGVADAATVEAFSSSELESFVFGYSERKGYRPADVCGGLNPRDHFRSVVDGHRDGERIQTAA